MQSTRLANRHAAESATGPQSHHRLVRGIEHVGMVVPDIGAAETFFMSVFGAEVLYRLVPLEGPDQSGTDMAEVNGISPENGFRALSMLRLGSGANLELFQVLRPTRERAPEVTDPGVTHFSIYCDDVKIVGEAMQAAGGAMLKGPIAMFAQEKGDGNFIWFGRTPWGSLIELIQLPVPVNCNAPGALHMRWLPSPP